MRLESASHLSAPAYGAVLQVPHKPNSEPPGTPRGLGVPLEPPAEGSEFGFQEIPKPWAAGRGFGVWVPGNS